jgi:hypothetical protein
MDNIDSRMSLVCIHQATICKCTLQSTGVLEKQLTLVMPEAIACRVSGLSDVTYKVQRRKLFRAGLMASGYLPLEVMHACTDEQTNMIAYQAMHIHTIYMYSNTCTSLCKPRKFAELRWQQLQHTTFNV